ncbi:MAG: glycosyltransferase, partial [Huintestinicola sp.]
MIKFSFVIPCYGSEGTIEKVIDEIEEVMAEREGFDYEIIAVNDCSPDNVLSVLRRLAEKHDKLIAADLSKNMGKHSAMMAGFSLVTGDYVVNLDDDGQCPMRELWRLYDALGQDNDIAMAKYPVKKQSAFKNFGSRINSLMSVTLINKPKDLQSSNFFIVKRYIVDEIRNYKNPYPYMEGLLLRSTRRIVNVEMEERDRFEGQGNFTFMRSLGLWINGFTAFSVKPLRVATLMGMIIAVIGIIYGIIIIVRKLLNPDMLMGYSSTMSAILFIGGMIMLMLGLIGEYIGRIYICINNSPQYVIREIIGRDE